MSNRFDKSYWTQRWQAGQTGWDVGAPSNPLREYIDSLRDHTMRILIPGGGNGYEVEYLWRKGFRNVFLLDISSFPLSAFAERNADFPSDQLICEDFFLHSDAYDLILEQTFFCALDPGLRNEYARQMFELLVTGGRLAGVLFNFPLTEEGPPFGGSEDEYRERFEPYFEINRMEICTSSIPPRAGRELFFELERIS